MVSGSLGRTSLIETSKVHPNTTVNVTYYCRDTFGEVQLGEITDESNSTLVKDQIFLSTEKYEIVKHHNEFKVCRGECPSLKWPQNPLNQIQTFHNLNAPSEFLHSSKLKIYSFRIIQSCLNVHKVRRTEVNYRYM